MKFTRMFYVSITSERAFFPNFRGSAIVLNYQYASIRLDASRIPNRVDRRRWNFIRTI